jgi:hypothetical protein
MKRFLLFSSSSVAILITLSAVKFSHIPIAQAVPNCDRAYPGVCIPPAPPDLDCKDISYRNFKVLSPDPHRFDGDRDGIGCESRK